MPCVILRYHPQNIDLVGIADKLQMVKEQAIIALRQTGAAMAGDTSQSVSVHPPQVPGFQRFTGHPEFSFPAVPNFSITVILFPPVCLLRSCVEAYRFPGCGNYGLIAIVTMFRHHGIFGFPAENPPGTHTIYTKQSSHAPAQQARRVQHVTHHHCDKRHHHSRQPTLSSSGNLSHGITETDSITIPSSASPQARAGPRWSPAIS